MRKIFILIPSDSPAGPVKGAYALANALAARREVTVVAVKKGSGAQASLDSRVNRLCLADAESSLRNRLRSYQNLLARSGGREEVVSISMCLVPDVLNSLCSRFAVTCSSVRANMVANYKMDYGFSGRILAYAHLVGLRYFDQVVAMTNSMARQIRRFSGTQPAIIGNFVDEADLSRYRTEVPTEGPLRFVFIGSLSQRKQPWLIVRAMSNLRERGQDSVVDFIGSGPMQARLETEIRKHKLQNCTRIHGFLSAPYELLAQADAMVLPSLSEGVPRAALEALYLGVPCVLRKVDGNDELISDGMNGALFSRDSDLAGAMLRAAEINRQRGGCYQKNMLPVLFSQETAASMYLDLLEST